MLSNGIKRVSNCGSNVKITGKANNDMIFSYNYNKSSAASTVSSFFAPDFWNSSDWVTVMSASNSKSNGTLDGGGDNNVSPASPNSVYSSDSLPSTVITGDDDTINIAVWYSYQKYNN